MSSELEQAQIELARGRWTAAARDCELLLRREPQNFVALVILGHALRMSGRPQEALAVYERASRSNPGHALPFTLAAVMRFRAAYGPPPSPAAAGAPGMRVQSTQIGQNGRFGNQLLQYAFLRLYARRHGLTAECPDWIGRDLYDLDDPLPSARLPVLGEDQVDWLGTLGAQEAPVYRDVDVHGYFVGHTAGWGTVQKDFRELFPLGTRVAAQVRLALDRLREGGRTVVAIHLRRGDFGYGRFWIAPAEWYVAWLRECWSGLSRAILYVATDEPEIAWQFAAFNPVLSSDLGVEIIGAPFLIDHEVLRDADLLAISNSTFSFTASMLNLGARTFLRPDADAQQLVPFDPWHARVLLEPSRTAVIKPSR
jgi:hypothetical protein